MPAIHFDITADNQQVLQSMQQTMQAITNMQKSAENAGKATEQAFDDMGKSAQSSGSKVGSMISRYFGVAAAITALGKVLGSAITVNKQFERKNSELAAVLGTTKKGVEGLTQAAKELGRTTEFTASEVTELQTALARLGFSENQIKAMETSVLKFAAAVGADLGSAAAFAGSALRGFGLEAKDTEHLLNVMAAATSKSALDFRKLEVSMSTVAPVAKSFGLTAEDAVALLGSLSNAGFEASRSAMAMKNILLNLADANGKLAKGLGHTATSFPEIIEALKECTEKGIDLNAALEMTDKQSVAAFTALINGADDALALRDALAECDGTLNDMYETMTDNLAGAVAQLKSAWEGLLLTMQNSNGPLAELVKRFARGTTVITGLIEGKSLKNIRRQQVGEAILGNATYSGWTTEDYRKEIDRVRNLLESGDVRGKEKRRNEQLLEGLEYAMFQTSQKEIEAAIDAIFKEEDGGGGGGNTTLTEEQKKAIQKAKEAYDKAVKELWKSVANTSVEAMQEGSAKVLAQIANEEKQALAQIDQELKELEETAKKAGKTVSQDVYDQFERRRFDTREIARNKRNDAYDQRLENQFDYLIEYGSYREKELAIKQKYDHEILKADDEFVKKTLQKQKEKALAELEMSESGVFRRIFADADSMTKQTLDDTIEYANALLQAKINAGANVEEIKALRDQIDKLQAASDDIDFSGWGGTLQGFIMARRRRGRAQDRLNAANERRSGLVNSFDRISNMESEEWRRLSEEISDATTAAAKWTDEMKKQAAALAGTKLADLLTQVGNAMAQIAELSGNDALAGVAEGFQEVGSVMGNIAQGFASGGLWGGIATAVTTVADKIISAFASIAVANAKYEKFLEDFSRELKMLELEIHDADFESAFGVDEYGKFVDAYSKMTLALENFGDASKNLSGTQIKTHDYSWWSNFWGKGDKYAGLKQFDIWGEDGLLDVGKAQAFLNASTQLTDKQREEIENAIELRNVYDELVQTTQEFVSSLTGGVVDSIADEMLDNFLETGSAIIDADKYLQDFNQNLAKSIIKSTLLNQVFTKEMEHDIASLLASGDTQGAISLYDQLLQQANEMAPQLAEFLQAAGVTDVTSQQATKGGFDVMNQQSADELNGRFAALQIAGENILQNAMAGVEHLLSIRSLVENGSAALTEIRDLMMTEVGYLEDIAKQTKPILEFGEKLDKIQENTSKL